MFKNYFKWRNVVAIAICLAGFTMFNACSDDDKGDDGNNNNGGNGGSAGITANNWQQTVKNSYGVNLNLPADWSFKEGAQLGSGIYVTQDIQFTTTADDFDATFMTCAQQVFNATETASSRYGNFSATASNPSAIENTLNALPVMIGTVIEPWYFAKSDGRVIQCTVSGTSATKTIQLSFITTVGVITGGGGGNQEGTPTVVRNLKATMGYEQFTVIWEAPTGNGGAEITGYEITMDNWVTKVSKSANELSHTYTGLTNGRMYSFAVRAVNANGAGEAEIRSEYLKGHVIIQGLPFDNLGMSVNDYYNGLYIYDWNGSSITTQMQLMNIIQQLNFANIAANENQIRSTVIPLQNGSNPDNFTGTGTFLVELFVYNPKTGRLDTRFKTGVQFVNGMITTPINFDEMTWESDLPLY
ncbi:MAG: fibronectin type III domain-containing protein [Prevotellaceae bacterium]|jgi:hypothetical protein|nr:fibronectin type III domain-containing protein [Prevotellaceae bacterium]